MPLFRQGARVSVARKELGFEESGLVLVVLAFLHIYYITIYGMVLLYLCTTESIIEYCTRTHQRFPNYYIARQKTTHWRRLRSGIKSKVLS